MNVDGCWVCCQGVKFMYDCVTGKQIEGSSGCIMADEMVTVRCSSALDNCTDVDSAAG